MMQGCFEPMTMNKIVKWAIGIGVGVMILDLVIAAGIVAIWYFW